MMIDNLDIKEAIYLYLETEHTYDKNVGFFLIEAKSLHLICRPKFTNSKYLDVDQASKPVRPGHFLQEFAIR